MENSIYTWKFSSKKERNNSWYIIALTLIISVVIWGFLTRQYGMSFIVLLISGLAYFVDNNIEDEIQVDITPLGIKIGESFYDYAKLDSYTLIYSGDNAIIMRLNLNQKGLRNLDLTVDNTVALSVKEALAGVVEENPKAEMGFVDRVIHLLKL